MRTCSNTTGRWPPDTKMMTHILRIALMLLLLPLQPLMSGGSATAQSTNPFPPMPVLSPGALTAYGANGRACLDWNSSIEDNTPR